MNKNAYSDLPLSDALAQLEACTSQPFECAQPIPPALNHAQSFLAHEHDVIFSKEWICIGREDEIPNPGDYLTHEVAGVSVLIVREKKEILRAFVNACAHRFACLVPGNEEDNTSSKGTAKRFTCRYHAWTYGLDGQLINAPYMKMKEGFQLSDHGLRQLQLSTWQGFVYVTLASETIEPPDQRLKTLTNNVVGRYDMGCYITVLRETMIWNANWKNLIGNFTESYHVPMAHGETFAKHEKPLEEYVCGEDNNHYGYHRAAQKSDTGLGAAHPKNQRLSGQWRRMMVDFCVFPNHLVTLMPDYLWYISVQPKGTDQMIATWGVAIPPEVFDDIPKAGYEQWVSEFKHYMDIANEEDKELVEALHIGTRSPLLPTGTYHPLEKNLWQFTKYLSRMCRGSP
ncbi:MAG: Rieske 2Fe-2S domain-containing protein [Gammaproteobacteria bacterium]|nr:Rieske 2Fe-2S domain-containing protein [Gammaproteobacteria bacterium]